MEKDFNYQRIYRDLKEAILRGDFSETGKLPTEAELQNLYGVSRITLKKAMQLLKDEDLIQRYPAKGTFVKSNLSSGSPLRSLVEKPITIGVMIPHIYSSFGSVLLAGISRQANARGCCLMAGLYYESLDEENEIIKRLIASGCSGIIVVPFHSNEGSNYGIVNCAMSDYPIVMADRYMEGISLPYVGSDHERASFCAMEHLFDLGHKNIGLVSSAPTTTAIIDRERGYLRGYAMTPYRVDPNALISDIRSSMPGRYSQENFELDVARMKEYFKANPSCTALLCIDYNIMRICETAALELGMRIPEDLSLVCFDTPDDKFIQSKYTHIRQRENEIGKVAVDMLIDAIEGNASNERVTVPSDLIIGSSTAMPRK